VCLNCCPACTLGLSIPRWTVIQFESSLPCCCHAPHLVNGDACTTRVASSKENLQRRHRNGGESRLLVVQKQGGKRARGVVHPTKEAPPWILDVDTLGFLLGVVQPQFPIRILLNGSLDNHAVPPGYLTVPSTVVCSFGQSTVILVAVILVVARAICGGLTLYSGKPAASCCSRAFEHLAFGRTKKPQALRERK